MHGILHPLRVWAYVLGARSFNQDISDWNISQYQVSEEFFDGYLDLNTTNKG